MPEDVLGPVRDFHGHEVETSVEVTKLSRDIPGLAYILCGAAADHVIREIPDFILVDKVFNHPRRAVAAIGVFAALSPVGVTNN